MQKRLLGIALLAILLPEPALRFFAQTPDDYFPGRDWERRVPERVGMDAERLAEAVSFAEANETHLPVNLLHSHHQSFGREPLGDPIGLFKDRGGPAGLILRHGYIVAEWGDTERVDMTFSVTKSFLSSTVGLAYDRGLIRDIHDPVHGYMAPVVMLARERLPQNGHSSTASGISEPFNTAHNRRISWDHLLRQTSDWEGTLWGKPDWADRPSPDPSEWFDRERHEPGTVYKYNDVRVNVLSLAVQNVWRRPLPEVLKEYLMDPIAASDTWRWMGYENSWILMDGTVIQAVSGGGHWGGGMFINAYDMARFGYLTLRRGRWNDRQILSEEWMQLALTPTDVRPGYGYMNFFLNMDRNYLAGAPESAFAHLGNGVNIVYVDPEHDLVIVARWIANDAIDGLVERVIASIADDR